MAKRVSALSQVLKETAPTPPQEPEQKNTEIAQEDNSPSSQNTIEIKTQRRRKTDERERITYYLDPEHVNKLDELRIAYRKATGKRINEQDLMRLIIDRIDLQHLI